MGTEERNPIPRVTESELKVLQYLWEKSPAGSKQIHEGLEDANWNIQTVKTLLSRLVDKKAISYDISGRNYMYYPIVQRDEYVVEESRSLLDKMFHGSLKTMVLNLVESNMVSDEELDELRRFLDKQGGADSE